MRYVLGSLLAFTVVVSFSSCLPQSAAPNPGDGSALPGPRETNSASCAPVTNWPYDASENVLLHSTYTNLGERSISVLSGSGVFIHDTSFPLAAVRISPLDFPEMPFELGADYEGTVQCDGGSNQRVVLTFHSPGVYVVKMESQQAGIPPTVVTVLVDAARGAPTLPEAKAACMATAATQFDKVEIPDADFGLFFHNNDLGDGLAKMITADLADSRQALKVDTFNQSGTMADIASRIDNFMYVKPPKLQTPITFRLAGHGYPSYSYDFADDNAAARTFFAGLKGKISNFYMWACCVGIGFPTPQQGGTLHLLQTIADQLSNFSDFAQPFVATASGYPYIMYFIQASKRPAISAKPKGGAPMVTATGVPRCADPLKKYPDWGMRNNVCVPSCGGLGVGTVASVSSCESQGLLPAGVPYDVPYCCKPALTPEPTIVPTATTTVTPTPVDVTPTPTSTPPVVTPSMTP